MKRHNESVGAHPGPERTDRRPCLRGRRYGSLVLQGGERADRKFTQKITRLLKAIKAIDTGDDPPLGITLSLGEQPREIYEEWFHAGAHRYLLRIESSNPDLYRKIHPADHSYDRRIRALQDLKELGYQAGTGYRFP